MPYRPEGKHTEAMKKYCPERGVTGDPKSNRSRCTGAVLADGKFRSMHDLHLMEATGADLDKVTSTK